MRYDIAVVIGRFQPVHKGHIPAFRKAAEIADLTVCVIGSANKPSNPKNPFSAGERIIMIRDALEEEKLPQNVRFVSIEDTHYMDQEWYRRVKTSIGDIAKEVIRLKKESQKEFLDNMKEGIAKPESGWKTYTDLHGKYDSLSSRIITYLELKEKSETCTVAVLGHDKDPSSYYLHGFANWDFVDIGAWVGDSANDHPISATDIRDLWFSGKLSFAKSNLHTSTYETLLEWEQNSFLDLQEEWQTIKKYREATQVGPFPVQFLTTDAVVIHGDEVLMIRRGVAPGKGLWALPGGFKNHNETFFESCVRELYEETSIKVPEKVLRGSKKEEKMFDYPDRSTRGTTVSMVYSFVLDPTQKRPHVKAGDDAVMAYWIPISDLVQMRDQIYEDHLDMIEYMTSRL